MLVIVILPRFAQARGSRRPTLTPSAGGHPLHPADFARTRDRRFCLIRNCQFSGEGRILLGQLSSPTRNRGRQKHQRTVRSVADWDDQRNARTPRADAECDGAFPPHGPTRAVKGIGSQRKDFGYEQRDFRTDSSRSSRFRRDSVWRSGARRPRYRQLLRRAPLHDEGREVPGRNEDQVLVR